MAYRRSPPMAAVAGGGERLARHASRAALNITPSPIGIGTGGAVRRALPCQQRMPQRAGGEM
ncbi:hypothetical protein GRB31_20805 (plasmid) [Ralstonia solanacearum]|nr:hypothetical protein GRB31_20805 [Ralstonia solanacearum]